MSITCPPTQGRVMLAPFLKRECKSSPGCTIFPSLVRKDAKFLCFYPGSLPFCRAMLQHGHPRRGVGMGAQRRDPPQRALLWSPFHFRNRLVPRDRWVCLPPSSETCLLSFTHEHTSSLTCFLVFPSWSRPSPVPSPCGSRWISSPSPA